jgi:hypothetical protein
VGKLFSRLIANCFKRLFQFLGRYAYRVKFLQIRIAHGFSRQERFSKPLMHVFQHAIEIPQDALSISSLIVHNGRELSAINVSRRPGGKPKWRITPEGLRAFELLRSASPVEPCAKQRRKTATDVVQFY